jgi:hypothetical protein
LPRYLAAAVALTMIPIAARADRAQEEDDDARFACAKPQDQRSRSTSPTR